MPDNPDALAALRDHRSHSDEAVAALANIDDFVEHGKANLTPADVANLKAMLALDVTLIAPRLLAPPASLPLDERGEARLAEALRRAWTSTLRLDAEDARQGAAAIIAALRGQP